MRREKDRKKQIINAFFSLAKKDPHKTNFTFREIAAEAGLTRQGIYARHFYNVGEMITYIHESTDKEIYYVASRFNSSGYSNPFEYIADMLLPKIYENRDQIWCLYYTNMDPTWKTFLLETYTPMFRRLLTQRVREEFSVYSFNIADFLLKLTIAMIETWIGSEEPLPPEEFKPIFIEITSRPIKDFFSYSNKRKSNS